MNIIWTKCPKRVYVGQSTLEMCVASAVLSYNGGGQGLLPVYEKVGIDPGYFATIGLKKLDEKREKLMLVDVFEHFFKLFLRKSYYSGPPL